MNYKYIIIIQLHLVIFSIILISSNKIFKIYSSSLISSHILHILARKEHIELTHPPTLKLSQKKKKVLCAKNLEDKKRDVKMPWHLEKNLVCHLGVEININMQMCHAYSIRWKLHLIQFVDTKSFTLSLHHHHD
jgi:hypothetical protein